MIKTTKNKTHYKNHQSMVIDACIHAVRIASIIQCTLLDPLKLSDIGAASTLVVRCPASTPVSLNLSGNIGEIV